MIKKKNAYKKMGLILLIAIVVGGIFGALTSATIGFWGEDLTCAGRNFLQTVQELMLPLIILIAVLTVGYGELHSRKMRKLGDRIALAEDEECDQLEYQFEKLSARASMMNILSQVVSVLVLSAGYSIKYIESSRNSHYLFVCITFILCYIYNAFWQVRLVKQVQRVYPEKKGDPASRKFQLQWLESCDEAEREIIYQSAYSSYITINRIVPILLLVTMLGQLIFDTGILAVIIVAMIWLSVSASYLKSSVCLRKKRNDASLL